LAPFQGTKRHQKAPKGTKDSLYENHQSEPSQKHSVSGQRSHRGRPQAHAQILRYLKTLRASINRFLIGRRDKLISQITPAEIQEYISGNGWVPSTMRS
jgi:hypothetical protein